MDAERQSTVIIIHIVGARLLLLLFLLFLAQVPPFFLKYTHARRRTSLTSICE